MLAGGTRGVLIVSWGRMYSNSTVVTVPYHPYNATEIRDWLMNYSRGEVEVHPEPLGVARVLFEFEDDATMFTLRWR